jgi:hypothetical protein
MGFLPRASSNEEHFKGRDCPQEWNRSACRFRMLLQVSFYEWTHRHNFQLIEMGKVQRSANQLVSQPAPARRLRDLSMNKRDAVLRAAILQHSFLISQRDLKLARGFIVCNGIVIHKTGGSVFFRRFYANTAPGQQFSQAQWSGPFVAAL